MPERVGSICGAPAAQSPASRPSAPPSSSGPPLFTLIADRCERRLLGITSNLVVSEWEKVFANPMATAAAIDRIVHHSVILEFDVPSYRSNAAQNGQTDMGADRQKWLTSITGHSTARDNRCSQHDLI